MLKVFCTYRNVRVKVVAKVEQTSLDSIEGIANIVVIIQPTSICERWRVNKNPAGWLYEDARIYAKLTWIQEKQEFQASIVDGVEF